MIPAFGFGDSETTDEDVFPFREDQNPCNGFEEVLERYNDIARKVNLSGPTSFAPIINRTISLVQESKKYHILVIIADGQVGFHSQPWTLNVRGPSYLGLTRSISWLLMPWLLASPGHQQPWYWLSRIVRSLSCLRKYFNFLFFKCILDPKYRYYHAYNLK